MKRLTEGEGIATDEKYGNIGISFANCAVVFASNDLPFEKMSDIDQCAFRQRIIVCKLPMKSFTNKDKFPFTTR